MNDVGGRKKIVFGKDIFFVMQYPPFYGMQVLGELQKIVLPALGGAAVGAKDGQNDVEGILGGLMMLSENITAEKLEKLSRMLLDEQYVSVKIGGKGAAIPLDENTLNALFTGRYFDMLVLMYEVAKVNFLDFQKLCGLPTGFAAAAEKIKQTFRGNFPQDLNENVSSTEPSKRE